MNNLNILVVDDKEENLFTMKQLLESEDLNVSVILAQSGLEALEKTLTIDFSLILLDVQMPEMNGYETAELLRGSKRTKFIPIIFVTANSREENNIFKGYESGAVDYLFKPINPIVLLSKIRVFIDLGLQKIELEDKTKILDQKIKELESLKSELEHKNIALEQLTMEDGLTSLGNRRCLDLTLDSEWQRGLRSKQPLSLVMIDIDHFKLYNDTYGHQEGDICLKRVASALKSTLKRQCDIVARYGGEEFIAVLPDTDLEGAVLVAERMRQAVDSLGISHSSSLTLDHVTVSLGVSTVIPVATSMSGFLIKAVDKALYKAKESGRNQVSIEKDVTVLS
ncbi:diguanylate cyclase [Thiospirochaeta perfilievii]|uniref:diguanylate cyclase n=1 Tax=Thiospirochaeta perfilievii TaxID=252967 RepID=A0A5C1QCY4_9SPIO|nr:diguanylate cyclase [Thiospirochaeta perfilievii]QEN04930.1 diguanylate cyclase [Thiospirochaeta perfilievii]